MLPFVQNAVAGLVAFVTSFWLSENSPIGEIGTGLVILFSSAIFLSQLGPSAAGFGFFLGSGWFLLNRFVDSIIVDSDFLNPRRTG